MNVGWHLRIVTHERGVRTSPHVLPARVGPCSHFEYSLHGLPQAVMERIVAYITEMDEYGEPRRRWRWLIVELNWFSLNVRHELFSIRDADGSVVPRWREHRYSGQYLIGRG